MKIQAAVLHSTGADARFQYEEVEMDTNLGDTEVLVEIKACGICQSDDTARKGFLNVPFPLLVLGHEGAGIVRKVGDKVKKVVPGDHVVLAVPYCGVCEQCRKGNYAYCENSTPLHGGMRPNGIREPRSIQNGKPVFDLFAQGSFAKMSLTNENNCIKVDDDVDLSVVAPLGCGIMTGAGTTLNYFRPGPGESIAIFGVGNLGLSAMMGAAICGSTKIIAVGRNDNKLAFAKEVGATDSVNTTGLTAEEIAAKIRELNGGKGVNYAIDTSGAQINIDAGTLALARFGELCIPATVNTITLRLSPMMKYNLKVSSIASGCADDRANVDEVLQMLVGYYKAGKLPVDRMITRYKWTEIDEAIEDMHAGKVIKPVLIMD